MWFSHNSYLVLNHSCFKNVAHQEIHDFGLRVKWNFKTISCKIIGLSISTSTAQENSNQFTKHAHTNEDRINSILPPFSFLYSIAFQMSKNNDIAWPPNNTHTLLSWVQMSVCKYHLKFRTTNPNAMLTSNLKRKKTTN